MNFYVILAILVILLMVALMSWMEALIYPVALFANLENVRNFVRLKIMNVAQLLSTVMVELTAVVCSKHLHGFVDHERLFTHLHPPANF